MKLVCPDTITKAPCDYVAYKMLDKTHYYSAGKLLTEQACYNSLLNDYLDETDVQLFPNYPACCVSNELYLKWMELCQQHGMFPKGVTILIEDGKNSLLVPKKSGTRQDVYMMFCCYRWSDSLAPLVWTVVEAMSAANGDFTLWQALHYALVKHGQAATGHSFTHITNPSTSVYNGCSHYAKDLANSIAIPFYLQMPAADRPTDLYVSERLRVVAERIGGSGGLSTKSGLSIKNHDELLTPRFTPLYQMEKPTAQALQKRYTELQAA